MELKFHCKERTQKDITIADIKIDLVGNKYCIDQKQ